MSQSKFLAVTRNLLKAWEKLHVLGRIVVLLRAGGKTGTRFFGQSLSKSDHNHVITFGSHLKTALWRHR